MDEAVTQLPACHAEILSVFLQSQVLLRAAKRTAGFVRQGNVYDLSACSLGLGGR